MKFSYFCDRFVLFLECKYDIFKQISLNVLNYKVILPGDVVLTPATSEAYEELQRKIKTQYGLTG